ncbi:MAG: hypothetical protein WAN68_22295, partial [Pseudolabrys sp.]
MFDNRLVSGNISFGMAFVNGSSREPRPAAGITALRIAVGIVSSLARAAVVPVEVAPIWTAPTRLNGHRGLLDSIVFTKTDMVGESRGQWYLRQMLGSAN